MSRRSEALKSVARNFLQVHQDWQNDRNRPNPDDEYYDAMEELFNSFAGGDIPAECRPLSVAVEAFRKAADAFEDREDDTQLYPPESFWRGVEAVKAATEGPGRRELPPLESIKELAALPFMQHVQICRMYGFIDRRGNPMPRLVQMELDSPGSVIGPGAKGKGLIDGRDWVDPRLAELDEQDGAAERNLEAFEEKGRAAKREESPCPESPRDLWEQNVPAAQAAKMLKQSEKDVRKQFADWTADRDFQVKVWGLVDKGVQIDQIAKQLKCGDIEKVKAAILARPQGDGESEAA